MWTPVEGPSFSTVREMEDFGPSMSHESRFRQVKGDFGLRFFFLLIHRLVWEEELGRKGNHRLGRFITGIQLLSPSSQLFAMFALKNVKCPMTCQTPSLLSNGQGFLSLLTLLSWFSLQISVCEFLPASSMIPFTCAACFSVQLCCLLCCGFTTSSLLSLPGSPPSLFFYI